MKIRTRSLLFTLVVVAVACTTARADHGRDPVPPAGEPTLVVRWNETLLECVRIQRLGPPMTARAIAIVHTAGFDAWACYDDAAVPTQPQPGFRRPLAERDAAHREKAYSFAVCRAIEDLFPAGRDLAHAQMAALGYDAADQGLDPATAQGVGNTCAANLLAFRHTDHSNQLGDLHTGAYSDFTGYQPVNTVDQVIDPNHWQPLRFSDGAGGFVIPGYVGAHWGAVTPFALPSGDALRPPGPARYPDREYEKQTREIIRLTAHIDDRGKVIAEYWADGPRSEQPPGHWTLFAEQVSRRDQHSFDDDVKMFFILGNALMDAGISVWEGKRFFDAERPITAIRFLHAGEIIEGYVPFVGRAKVKGEDWVPYQAATFLTPPFAEYPSGHSGFSAAGAEILRRFTGSDRFESSVTFAAGSSHFEPGFSPSRDVTLSWHTFSEAADEAGMSRRIGGIHFADGDLHSRVMGRQVGAIVWAKAQEYITGISGPVATRGYGHEDELHPGSANDAAPRTDRVVLGPNPTSGRLTVSFAVSRDEDVQASVLDLQGRTVAVLASGPFAAGSHQLVWDGQRQAPGMYFLRLRRGGVESTQRVLIAR
jgi:hypothetical protein